MRLFNLIDEWLYVYHKDNVRTQTFLRYECTVKNYILTDDICKRQIRKITSRDIQEFLNNAKKIKSRKTKTNLSAGNINIIITVLKLAFEYAVDFGLLKFNPCVKIKRLLNPKPAKVAAFTVQEQMKIENYIISQKNPEYFGIILCLYTGLRIGELMALEWNDIDFESGIMRINKTRYITKNDQGEWIDEINDPKTNTSNRIIPIPNNILIRLKKEKALSKSINVISKKNGKTMSANLYRVRFGELTKKIGVRNLNFHALRHTFATRALESGMDVKTLADIMGHANASITLNIYAHSMIDHKITMMNNIPILVEYQ